jgi:hypothetical protein
MDALQRMTPGQILAAFVEQNPALVPALQAYASAEASQQQTALLQQFQERLVTLFGNNQNHVQAVVKEAMEQVGTVASAKLKAARPQFFPNAENVVRLAADPSDPSMGMITSSHARKSSVICSGCHQLILPPIPEDRRCPQCHQSLPD